MSEELTKNQKNLVNVLNYCLETKHDFDGNRSNKLTRLFARQVLNCMSLPKILSNEQESNFQDDILTDFGLDIDSVQRDSYMETEMVLGVFLNPKTYHPNVDIKENLEIWAYKHDIKYSDTGIDDDASGTMPETLYKCNLMMGELELDKEEKLEANAIYEYVMNFIQDRKVIIDTIPKSFNYIYNKIKVDRSKQPFTKDWDPATLQGEPLDSIDLSATVTDANDVRKIYNAKSVSTLKSFSKKVLNIIPVYDSEIEGDNQTQNCSSIDKTGNKFCIIRNDGDNIPKKSQLLLLFNSSENDSDFSFENEAGETVNYSLPFDIGDNKKTHIISGFSVKELSSGIGLLVKLRNPEALLKEFTQFECGKIKTAIKTEFKKANQLSKTGLRLCWNIIDSIFKNKTSLKYDNNKALTVDDALQYGILIMLDLKKAGDWGLVDYCKKTNSVLLTLDRLCGLYALIKNASVLFSGSFYPGYKTWVLYNGDTSIKVMNKSDITKYIDKSINDFNKSSKKRKLLIEAEMDGYKTIIDENCVDNYNGKPDNITKFKNASMKYEYLKKLLAIYNQNNIYLNSDLDSTSIYDYLESFLKDINDKLMINFSNRTNSLYSEDSFIKQIFDEKSGYILFLIKSISDDAKYSVNYKPIIIDGEDPESDIDDVEKFKILSIAKNIIANIEDIYNLIRFVTVFYKPCDSLDCNPDYHNLLYNYKTRVLGIYIYPNSRQTIVGKKFGGTRSSIADKNEEIKRAFEENIHRSRVSKFNALDKLSINLSFYKNAPFQEIFSKQIDFENIENDDDIYDKKEIPPKMINDFNKIFDMSLLERYLNSITDRQRKYSLNNLVAVFDLLRVNTYPGIAVDSIIKINKMLKTKKNIFTKLKKIDLVDSEIVETSKNIDLGDNLTNIKNRLYNKSIENGILNTIFFITYFIEICKKSLLDTYTDSEQIINFKEKISLVTDQDYLISDLLLILFSEEIVTELPQNGEYSVEQREIIQTGENTINGWMDEINTEYESDNFEIYIDTKFEAFIKNFEDLMEQIHSWRSGSVNAFCIKKLKSLKKKYNFLFTNKYAKLENVDKEEKSKANACEKALSEAYSSYGIRDSCNTNNGVSRIKSLAILLILLSNDRNRSGQEKSSKVYEGIFFAKDPLVMKKISNLGNIQLEYIKILQNLYNMSQNEEKFSDELKSLTGWDKSLTYKNCSNIDKLFVENEEEGVESDIIILQPVTNNIDSIDKRIREINISKPKIEKELSDSKENQTYELSTSNSPYNLSINDDDQEEEDEEEDEEDNEEEDEEDKDEEEEDDDEVDSIDILYKIGRKGMKQFINDYTSEDACTNNDKSECNSDSACTWINYDYTKSKKTIGTKCITTSSFKKLPQSSEDDCCSPIRTTSCSGMVHCIDKHSDKYLSGYDYPQFGGNNSEIDNIIRLESQLEDLDEELAYLTHKKMRLISNDKSYDSLGERVEGIKIKSELGPDRVLYDINCEDIDLENCGENDKLFKFCKKSDDSLHCERNNQKLLNLEFVETGNVDEFKGEERLTYEALHIVKYLVMNINLYNNCVYGSEINTLSRDYSNTELVSNIKEYINSFISSKSEKISTNINLVDYISSTIGNINEISQKVKGFIDENTQLDGSNRRVLKRGNLAHDVIIFLSGITIKLINDQLISRFIKHTVTNNYTNKCSLVKFKNGSKNTFDIVNNLENIVDFSDNERAFMKSIVTNTEATLDNSEFKNKALNKFLITKTRSEDANFSREIEKLLSKNKEDFINDTNLVGKLKESLSYVDIDGNILEDSQIYDKDINKYSQIIDLVDKLNFYMEYYPEIMKQLRRQPHLLVDSKLYFEDMIVLPYMNAAYLIMLYYPVIEHIVNDKYI